MPELKTVTGPNFHPDVARNSQVVAHTDRTDDPHNTGAYKGQVNGFASLGADAKIPLNQLPNSILDGLDFQGTWDATGAAPSLTPTDGQYWIVEVAGTTDLDGITTWNVGDWALYSTTWTRIAASSSLHNVLTDLQGGDVGEYYHLNTSEYNVLVGGASNADALHTHTISGQVEHNLLPDLQGGNYDDTMPEYYHLTEEEYNSVSSAANPLYHVVYVSKDGNDSIGNGSIHTPYLTVKAALNSITDNSDTNRYVILVAPGVYVEDNPLVMKSNVDIKGMGGVQQTNITALNTASNVFTATPDSELSNLIIAGTNQYAIDYSSAGIFVIRDISISNCSYGMNVNNTNALVDIHAISAYNDSGSMTKFIYLQAGQISAAAAIIVAMSTIDTCIHVTGTNSLAFINGFISNSNNVTTGILVENDADVTLSNIRITGDLGSRMGTAIKVLDGGSEVDILSSYIQHADYGIYMDNTCVVDVVGSIIEDCDYGIYVGTNDSPEIHIYGGSVGGSISWDIYLDNSAALLHGSGVCINENKLYLDDASVYLAHLSSNEGDEGLSIKGELHVGSPERGNESVFGEGDSYTRGLLAYTYNGSTYTDISTAVRSFSGSTFTFPNLDINSAIYLSSDLTVNSLLDFHKFFGIKMSIVTAQVGGAIVAEYWNGSTWSTVNTMTTDSGGAYLRKSNTLFTNTPGTYQVRFNPNINDDWTKNNPPSVVGGNRYWIRFRITSTLTTAPIFDQFKLHSNRTEINSDGYVEYFGLARSYVGVNVPWSSFQDAGTSLGDQDLWVSTNCKTGFINNNFNTNGDSIGAAITLPSWVDTSAPLIVRGTLVSSLSGTLNMIMWLKTTIDGDTIYTSNPSSTVGEISSPVSKTVVANQQITYTFSLDISSLGVDNPAIGPATLWLNLEADSRPGNVYGITFATRLLQWRLGSHINA